MQNIVGDEHGKISVVVYVVSVVSVYAYAWWAGTFEQKRSSALSKIVPKVLFLSTRLYFIHCLYHYPAAMKSVISVVASCLSGAKIISDYEVIVINDNSTDKTGHILEELARSHPSGDRLHLCMYRSF